MSFDYSQFHSFRCPINSYINSDKKQNIFCHEIINLLKIIIFNARIKMINGGVGLKILLSNSTYLCEIGPRKENNNSMFKLNKHYNRKEHIFNKHFI